jgi:hypothetical protein
MSFLKANRDIKALYNYIQCVNEFEENKIFTINYQHIMNIFKEVIKEAEMDFKVITTCLFHSSSVTSRIKNGVNSDQLMKTDK